MMIMKIFNGKIGVHFKESKTVDSWYFFYLFNFFVKFSDQSKRISSASIANWIYRPTTKSILIIVNLVAYLCKSGYAS